MGLQRVRHDWATELTEGFVEVENEWSNCSSLLTLAKYPGTFWDISRNKRTSSSTSVLGDHWPGRARDGTSLSSVLGGVMTCDNPGLSLDPVTGKNGKAWGLIQGDMDSPCCSGIPEGSILKTALEIQDRGGLLSTGGSLESNWTGRARKFKVKIFILEGWELN